MNKAFDINRISKTQIHQIAKLVHKMENENKQIKEDKIEKKRLQKIYKNFFDNKKNDYNQMATDMVSTMINSDYMDETENGLDEYCNISLAYHIDNEFYKTVFNLAKGMKDLIKDVLNKTLTKIN